MNAREEAKREERRTYEAWYGARTEFSPEDIRSNFLARSERRFLELLKRHAPGSSVFEIGCGTGEISIVAAEAGATVLGLDIAENAIAIARTRAERSEARDRLSFAVGDIEQNSLPQGSFDLIIDHEVFSSLDFKPALTALTALLKPGGRLLCLECLGHNPVFNLNRRLGVLRGRRTAWSADHMLMMRDIDFARTLFSEVEVEYFHLSIFCAYPLRRLIGPALSRPFAVFFDGLDRMLLRGPALGRWAFKAVIMCRK